MTKEEIQALKDTHGEDAVKAYIEAIGEEYLDNFEEEFQGKADSDEDFVRELLESCGDIPKDLPAYIHIDWESTARDVLMDYTEQDGFYFRN